MLCGLGLEKFPQSFLLINSWAIHFSNDKCFSLGIEAIACLLKEVSFLLDILKIFFHSCLLFGTFQFYAKLYLIFFSHLVNKTKKGKNTSTKKSVIKISPLAPACKLLNMQCIQGVRCQIRCRTACDFCHTRTCFAISCLFHG